MIFIGKHKSIVNKRFGRLKVIEELPPIHKNNNIIYMCKCECDCGNYKNINYYSLVRNLTKSCGCLHSEITKKNNSKRNKYDLSGEYGICYTSKGEEFYFDLEDYDKIKDYCWLLDKDGYPRARMIFNDKIGVNLLSRFLINVLDKPDLFVDHINGNIIDNRKQNLRIVTKSQNNMNKIPKTEQVGVRYDGKRNKWIASLTCNGNRMLNKSYYSKEEAILARQQAEDKYFGEYSYRRSRLNNK